MELDDILARRLQELCNQSALECLEQALGESAKAGAPDTLSILSLLRAANVLRRIGYKAARERGPACPTARVGAATAVSPPSSPN